MLSLSDVDNQFIKCIGYLHTNNFVPVKEGNPIALQNFLEEAIKNKTGVMKDLSNIVSSCLLKQELVVDEFKPAIVAPYEESKASNSDNELELDLLKEDLMCVVCNGMDVAARNRLLECSDCHALYHQECHNPVVVLEDSFSSWICQNCKVNNHKCSQSSQLCFQESKKPSKVSTSSTELTEPPPSKSSKSSSHRHSSTSSSSSYKSTSSNSSTKSNDKYKSSSPSNTSKSAQPATTTTSTAVSTSSSSSSSSRSGLSPNINIISADKRIQNMKKKAAKMQEKRKQLSR